MIGSPPPPLPPPLPEVPPPPPPPPPIDRNEEPQQHGQFYAQQDQDVSAAQSQNAQVRSQEEEWALRARAWANSKSSQAGSTNSATDCQHRGQPLKQDGQLYKAQQPPADQLYQQQHASNLAALWSAPAQFEQTIRQPVPYVPPHMFPGTPPGTFPAPGYRPAGSFGFSVDPGPKKSAVPSWLREELKKKGAASAAPDGMIRNNGTYRVNNVTASSDTEAEEDEEELETLKAAAINQEIKKVLTDVLLKVTDGLFNEIAEEILNEVKKDVTTKDANSRAAEARIVFAAIDGDDSARASNLLGLASYDSDNDVKEGENSSPSKLTADRIFGPLEADESAPKEQDADTRAESLRKKTPEDSRVQENDTVPLRTDKQHNKENEHRTFREHRSEHKHRERKRSRQSSSPARSSRSNSPASPRKRRDRRNRSRSPRACKRESSSWSRSRSPRKRSPSREKHRHKHSRSRSPRRKRR